MDERLLRSPLHDRHAAAGATMVERDGWLVPARYGAAADEEVLRVRRAAGVFDRTHQGRIRIRGEGALELLGRVCTAEAARQEDDTAVGTLLCRADGGLIDVCRLLRLEGFWVLLTSPSRRGVVLEHLAAQAADFDAQADDQTDKTAAVTVAGPAAGEALDALLPIKVSHLGEDYASVGSLMLARYIAIRGGLGRLWAITVVLPNLLAGQAWRFITDKAGAEAIASCGQEAWEVLRIEAGIVRWGCEVDEAADPFAAGLGSLISFDHDFLGAEALGRLRDRPPSRRLMGLAMEFPPNAKAMSQAVPGPIPEPPAVVCLPAEGAAVSLPDGTNVGTVTSAAYSPTLRRRVAMAYVAADLEGGAEVRVAQPGSMVAGRICALPFALES